MFTSEIIRFKIYNGDFEQKDKIIEKFMETANNGDINFFKDVFKDFKPNDIIYLNTILLLDNILKYLINYSINNYDEEIMLYICKECPIYLYQKYRINCVIYEEIQLCIDKNMFDFAKLLIDSSKSSNNFYYYLNYMNKIILEDSIIKVQFMLDNFKIKDIYKLNFMSKSMCNPNIFIYLHQRFKNTDIYTNCINEFNKTTRSLIKEANPSKSEDELNNLFKALEEKNELSVNTIKNYANNF